MENIIRGTTPSLVVDFGDITDFTVQEIDEIALTVKSRTQHQFIFGHDSRRLNDGIQHGYNRKLPIRKNSRHEIYPGMGINLRGVSGSLIKLKAYLH